MNIRNSLSILLFACAFSVACGGVDDREASAEDALTRGSFGPRVGFSCTDGGYCECDKSIEGDCEDMTAVCTEGTVDALIRCLEGTITTHCSCTEEENIVRPTIGVPTVTPPTTINGG